MSNAGPSTQVQIEMKNQGKRFLLIHSGLLCLILFSAVGIFHLSWKEYIRIGIVLLALLYLSSRRGKFYFKSSTETVEIEDNSERGWGLTDFFFSAIIALAYTFLITQFDPIISKAVALRLGVAYVIATSFLVILIFGLYLIQQRELGGDFQQFWLTLTLLDRLIFCVLGVVFLISLLSTIFAQSDQMPHSALLTSVKSLQYMVIWHVVTRVYTPLPLSDAPVSGALKLPRYRTQLWFGIIGLLTLSLLAGLFRTGTVLYSFSRANDAFKISHYSEAQLHYERVRQLNGSLQFDVIQDLTLRNLALIYFEQGRDEDGEQTLDELRKIYAYEPGSAESRIADVYYLAEKWENAAEIYRNIGKIEIPALISHIKSDQLIYLWNTLSKGTVDIPNLDPTDLGPLSYEEMLTLGSILLDNRLVSQSRAVFQIALSSHPNSALALLGLGKAAIELGQIDEATQYLEQALVLAPQNADILYSLGTINLLKGNISQAVRYFERALDSQPGHLRALGALSQVLEQNGDHERSQTLKNEMRVRIGRREWISLDHRYTEQVYRWAGTRGYLGYNGSCWNIVDLYEGNIKIEVYAGGTPSFDTWPQMQVYLDEKKLGSIEVKSHRNQPESYEFETSVDTGKHLITIRYANDAFDSVGGNRDLFIYELIIIYLN